MLIDDFLQVCTKRVISSVSDGEGGETVSWSDGTTFNGAVIKNASSIREIAGRDTVYTSYTLTVKGASAVSFHDVFKTADGREFRVISKTSAKAGDETTPARASFSLSQVEVEEFVE